MAASSVRTEVVSKVGLVSDDNLEAILTSLDLAVNAERRKKEKAVYNAIVRYLTSVEVEDLPDEGLSIFLKLKDDLVEMLKEENEQNGDGPTDVKEDEKPVDKGRNSKNDEGHDVKQSVVVDATVSSVATCASVATLSSGATGPAGAGATGVTKVEYHRVKDFRIEGGTVCGSLSYRNVRYQMDKGRELGYSETAVMNGTIKAMKPGTLRTYCETSGSDLEYDEFVELLHNYTGVENATLMLTRLNNSFQGDEYADEKEKEKEADFVLRVGGLRKTVMKIAKEEGTPLSEEIVSEAFRHALAVGIRRDVIRLQVQSIIQGNERISDPELLRKIQLIMANDRENQKTKGQGSAGVNAVYLDNQQQHARREDTPRIPLSRSNWVPMP